MKKYLWLFILGVILQACGGETSTSETTSSEATSADEATPEEIQKEAESIEQAPAENSLKTGSYCFKLQDKITTAFVELELKEDGSVSGGVAGSAHDQANSYFAAYDMTIEEGSTWTENEIDVRLTIEVEGDTQQEEEIWSFDGGHLMIGQEIYVPADCAEKEKIFEKLR